MAANMEEDYNRNVEVLREEEYPMLKGNVIPSRG